MITITSLSKAFGSVPVIRNASLEVRKGETVVILGHSGSGKTTLLRCLVGLTAFDSGTIEVDGIHLAADLPRQQRRRAIAEIRKRCGFLFQQYHLFPHLDVLKNVSLAPVEVLRRSREDANTKAVELLSAVGLAHKAGHRPFQLSGGEQQRVAIARALAMEPAYLLYDEPTSALDPQRAKDIWQLMRRLAEQGQTQVVVTHQEQIQDAIPCRVIRMAEGQILSS